ncbi:MAG: VOC family protein [Gemmataceae bacterium]
MPGIVGVHHTSFTVGNLNRSLEFFRDLLGFELLATREIHDDYFGQIVGIPGCVAKIALLRMPATNHVLELLEYVKPRGQAVRPQPNDSGSAHLAFLVDNMMELYEELHAMGFDFVGPPVSISAGPNRGGMAVYLRDPNGILIEFIQPPP